MVEIYLLIYEISAMIKYLLSFLIVCAVFIPSNAQVCYSLEGQFAKVEYVSGSEAVADSLLRLAEHYIPAMADLFDKHVKQVEAWMTAQPHLQYLDVDYNAMLADPTALVPQINRFLGGALDESAMLEVVDPKLYRQRK